MSSIQEQAADTIGKFSRTEQAAGGVIAITGGIGALINPALLIFAGGGVFLYFHGRNRHKEADNVRTGQAPIPKHTLRRLHAA